MRKHPILLAVIASLALSATLLFGVISNVNGLTSVFHNDVEPLQGVILIMPFANQFEASAHNKVPTKQSAEFLESHGMEKRGEWTYCDYQMPAEPINALELESVDMTEKIAPGGKVVVNVTMKNTGNTRFFSAQNPCENMSPLNLGTQKSMDRESIFGQKNNAISGWLSPQRVKMMEKYVDPGESVHFIFSSVVPDGDNIYREFFQPVLDGPDGAWLYEPFALDISVGSPSDEMKDNMRFIADTSLFASSLEGKNKNILVDLSDQTLQARFGDLTVWSMKVSSGKSKTPTPQGNYSVLFKQELRIGGEAPHYRMPYWMAFRRDGYGLHALPYLANDKGQFWQEAYTHIGTPVSHGCVRILPDDARTLYEFAPVGTPVVVQK